MKIKQTENSERKLTRMDQVAPGSVFVYTRCGNPDWDFAQIRTDSMDFTTGGNTCVSVASGALGWDHPETKVLVLTDAELDLGV